MRKTVLIVGGNYLRRDPRIRRQIFALKEQYNIIATGIEPSDIEGVDEVSIQKPANTLLTRIFRLILFLLRRYDILFWTKKVKELFTLLSSKEIDVIIANDVKLLPLAIRLSKEKHIPVYCDLHEYAPGQVYDYKIIYGAEKTHLCNTYFPFVHRFSTVNSSIKKLYKDNFDIDCEIITNAGVKHNIEPVATIENEIKLVHHGLANKARHLEVMIDIMDYLDPRFSLHFYLVVKDKEYFEKLKTYAENKPVFFHEPVAYEDIIPTINKYDIGIFVIPPTNINYKYTLPNKFFEFAQARLAISVGATPDMKELVEKYSLGVAGDDFDPKAHAELLNSLKVSDIMKFKENSKYLNEVENSEINMNKISKIVSELANS